MLRSNSLKYDKLISEYIKDVILENNLSYQGLVELSQEKFNKEELTAIQNGNYTFGLEELMHITQLLNIDLNTLFENINSKRL